jgi:hypothetical protein
MLYLATLKAREEGINYQDWLEAVEEAWRKR